MRRMLGTLIAVLITQIGFSQDYQSDFQKYCQTNDTINQLKVLTEWNSANPKDAELYTSYFNYHFMKSKQEVLAMSSNEPNEESLVLKDSLNQAAGFLGSTIHFDQKELENGINKIDEGIKLYPNRLDMRFGKIYAMGKIEDWENFTIEIIRTINHSKINNNKWLWTNDVEKTDGKLFMLSSIQSYQMQLYNTENDNLLPKMQQIALAVLEIYQDHIESMSNLSVTYFLNKKYDQGIEILLKAEKLSPKDYVILSNIAHGYNLKGNKTKSIEYYEKTLLYGTDEAKAFAKEKIEKLKK